MPGTTNFLVFDPPLSNAESDAAYAADSLRSGGATFGAILPSTLFNKFAYQVSSFCAALAQSLANKGYTVSDANYSTLTTVLNNIQTVADATPLVYAVTTSGSVTTGHIEVTENCNTTGGSIVRTLYDAAASGQKVNIAKKDGSANTITVQTVSGQLIDSPWLAVTSLVIASPGQSVTLQATGTGWIII